MSKRIIFLMNRWASVAGGIQTVNRELATAIVTQRIGVDCTAIVPHADDSERVDALSRGVTLISGTRPDDWTGVLLSSQVREIESSSVLAVVGHSYFSGSEAFELKTNLFPQALSVQIVHMSPLHIESLKEYKQDSYVREREAKQSRELELARRADLVICIGPRLYRSMHDLMASHGHPSRKVRTINCGISSRPEQIRTPPKKPTVLCTGRTDSTIVKGLDIFAYAAGYISASWAQHPSTRDSPPPQFVVRGVDQAPEEFERRLVALAEEVGLRPNLLVRPYTAAKSDLTADFRGATVFLMPSREEGFGLVACEALSQGVPTLVSENSGIGELIRDVARSNHLECACVVSMAGDAKQIARRFADAVLDVLVREDRAASYFNLLSERLRPLADWSAGAQQFLEAIRSAEEEPGAGSRRPGSSDPLSPGIQWDAMTVLDKHRKELSALPGLITMGVRSAIVLTFSAGQIPSALPTEFDGVPVIAREGMPVQTTAGEGGDASRHSGALIVDGKHIASVALIFEGSNSMVFAVTVAHALDDWERGTIRVGIRGEKYDAQLVQLDRDHDWALLSLSPQPLTHFSDPVREPAHGQVVYIDTPQGRIEGAVAATELTLAAQTIGSPDRRPIDGLFEIVTQQARLAGASGSTVFAQDGAPIGMLVAATFGDAGDRTNIYAAPLAPIIRKVGGYASDARAGGARSSIALLVAGELALHALLKTLNDVERVTVSGRTYFEGQPPGSNAIIRVSGIQNFGNIAAAISATTLMLDNDVKTILVVGLCGGLLPQEQDVGDVVISSDIIYYEPGVLNADDERVRFRISGTTPPSILSSAREVAQEHSQQHAGGMRVHLGTLASGEKVVRSLDRFTKMLPGTKILGVEMEAAGVCEAVAATGRDVRVAAIRGIADFSDDSKRDSSQIAAAENAVEIALELAARLAKNE